MIDESHKIETVPVSN